MDNSISISPYDLRPAPYRLGGSAKKGRAKKPSYQEINVSTGSLLLDNLVNRLHAYRREEMKRGLALLPLAEAERIEALNHDPHCGPLPSLIEVRDEGRPLDTPGERRQADAYFRKQNCLPIEWNAYLETGRHAPYNFRETSFIHLFSTEGSGQRLRVAVILDVYRPPWKPYFTSDVFLSQWVRASHYPHYTETEAPWDLGQLPPSFPPTLYINNITHKTTLRRLKSLLERHRTSCFSMPCTGHAWDRLSRTPHVRYLYRILEAYNDLNRRRGYKSYQARAVQVYGQRGRYHLKFSIWP